MYIIMTQIIKGWYPYLLNQLKIVPILKTIGAYVELFSSLFTGKIFHLKGPT